MKKALTMIALMMGLTLAAMAQDVIMTKQSERIDATVLEVSDTEVKYKKQSNPNGPTFTLATSKIASITYSNGEVQTFADVKEEKSEPFDRKMFGFLPESTKISRNFGAHLGYFVPFDLELFDGNSHLSFPSDEASLYYGYTFNENFSANFGVGVIDINYDWKEHTTGANQDYNVRSWMISMPIYLDFSYSFTSWNVRPAVGLRGGLMVNLVSAKRAGISDNKVWESERYNNSPWFGVSLGAKKDRAKLMFEVLCYGITEKGNNYGEYDEYRKRTSYGDVWYNITFSLDLFSKIIR